MQLRPYQAELDEKISQSWGSGNRNVLAVLPTGGGKTVLFSEIIARNAGAACAIAHRQELVSQISVALARVGLRHRIIGPETVIRQIVKLQRFELGKAYYDPQAPVAVAGVDTLVRRMDRLQRWADSVTLWVQDEAHHVLEGNKWGNAAKFFPNARGLGVTATPLRADGKGLGRRYDGLFDEMVVGPPMRQLIDMGYLSDYRIFAPPSDLDLSNVKTSAATGDYNRDGLVKAVRRSHIVGDVVKHYLRIAPRKLGVTFAVDVEEATHIAEQFEASGIPAKVVSAKTPDLERVKILRRFRNREILQLVNVDIFGEGFDLPAIEVVSMARPTQSYALFVQQFGRGLRILEGKDKAIIIDHVGNVTRHGLPDAPKPWTLERRASSRSGESDGIPVKSCPACTAVFERIHKVCPFCNHYPEPAGRSGPQFVDGDLEELDLATLAAMRGAVEAVDMPAADAVYAMKSKGVPVIGQKAGMKRHVARQEAQRGLRESIALWAGHQRALSRPDSESYRRFFFKFGVDVLTAQALGEKEALELKKKVDSAVTFQDWS